jgi:hypothetical protein
MDSNLKGRKVERSTYRRCSRSLIPFLSRVRKLLFILALAPWIGPQKTLGADSNPSVSILSSSQAGTTLKVTPGFHPQRAIKIKDRVYTLFDGVVPADGDEGKPLLPFEGILIGIPPTASVSLEISNSSYSVLSSQLIAPAPHNRFDEYMNAHQEYTVDEAAYSRNVWYPSVSAELAEVSHLRYQRVAKILVHPYQYNPATDELRKFTALTLNVRFTYPRQQREAEAIRPAGADPHFEGVYKSLLVNYDDAKKWRGVQVKNTLQRSPADTTGNWFDPSMPYVRLLIVQDGLYKLTYNDLSSEAVNLATINPQTFKVYNHGAQVSLFVAGESDGVMDPTDYIEFYAQRNYGKGEFFDTYTDTNVYWLTYGGANGLRMVVETTDTTGIPALSFQRTVHFEQDNLYYSGYNDDEIIQPENVPGEGWYWSNFYPGTTTGFDFTVQNVVATAQTSAVLRVRFNGMSQHSATPDHIAKLILNGTDLGQVGFDFTSDTVFTVSFPSTLLKEGTNTLTVQSLTTQAQVNEFYLDWFEVSYQCAFKAVSDQLTFTSQGTGGSMQTQYTITNFQSAAIDVYNLTDRKKFTNARVGPVLDAGVAVTFHDTASVSKQYVVVAEDQKLKPARIELKQFKDIRNNPTGADYIIITHRLFKQSADRLANYRASQMGVRAVVIDVQDIYDEFNYGVFSPEAIKPFLLYAFTQWARPAPAYVLLFGDASWDFKFHLANSVKQNFVPAYGSPPTDNWFVAFDSTNSVPPSMMIGRIPAENTTEAEQVVDKLTQYDQAPSGEWLKDFLFITGGNDDAEKSSFNGQAEYLITNYAVPAPIGGFPYRVYKKTDAIIDGENKQLIQDIVSNGTVFLNFIGHSGGRIWGVDAGDPNTLQNTGGQFVFVTSVSCNVAAFATSFSNVLTEDWLFASGRAAIACWAASSLGYPDIGFSLTNDFLGSVTRDSIRSLGMLTTSARIQVWKDSPASPRVNAAMQLEPLLGDPIGLLALPVKPDLSISSADVSFDPAVPTEIDSLVTVKSIIKNYGLVPNDSVSVKFTDTFGGLPVPIGKDTYRLPPVFLRDSLLVIWDVARRSGNHTIAVQIDPLNQISEVTKANNRVDVPIEVFASRLLPIRPAASSVIPRGPESLEVTAPSATTSGSVKYFFEVDTTSQFNSSVKITSPAIDAGILTTKWTTSSLTSDGLYYWRSRTYDGRDSGAWVTSSFVVSGSPPPASIIRWTERDPKQLLAEQRFQADVTDSGVTIAKSGGVPIYVRSLGYRNNADKDYYSVIKVIDQTVTALWWVIGNGFVVASVNEIDGSFEYRGYDVSSNAALADSMAQYLQNVAPDLFIVITVVVDGYTNDNERLYSALEALGAKQIRSVRPGESWAFIAQKRTSIALESYSKDSVAEISYLIPSFYNVQTGRVATSNVGPARRWRSVSWANDASGAGTDISLKVVGVKSNGAPDTLLTLPKTILSADLGAIDTKTYPMLSLVGSLQSSFGTATPILKSWSVEYEGPPDPAIAAQLVRFTRDSVLEGETVEASADIYNIGYTTADSLKVNFYLLDQTNARKLIQSSQLYNLDPDNFKTVGFTVNGTGLRGLQTLVVELDSKPLVELYNVNDVATRTFYIQRDTTPPQLQVTFDGAPILNGDYVSAKPNILIKLFDNSPLPIQDTSNVALRLDNQHVPYVNNPQLTYSFPSTGSEKAELQFRPELTDGSHSLFIDGQDASGNPLSGSTFRVDFSVRNAPTLQDVYNYPNPFPYDTYFTFNLTGSTLPDELKIRIYTVAGRLIHTLLVPVSSLHFGFNRFYWDGRDYDGNEIANGVYFYTMVLKNGDKTDNVTQRLAKVR